MIASLNYYFVASALNIATQRVDTSWRWYVIRAAGLVAAGLIILLMLSGIGQVTGLTYRFIEPVKAWAIHKALAIALCISIAIHVLFLVLDKFIPFTWPQVLLPFLSHYNNGTAVGNVALGWWAVTFGVLAMYGVIIVVASSLGWINTKRRTWRWLHYVSYAVLALVLLHGIYIGTDIRYGTFRTAWIVAGIGVLLAILSRLRRIGTTRETDDSD